MSDSDRRSSFRTFLVVLGVVAILGTLAYMAQRKGWFARDSQNHAEIEKLQGQSLAIGSVASSWWPQWRGANRDGRVPEHAIRTDWDKRPPQLLWSAPCGGGFSSCVVQNGRLYTQDRQGDNERVFCLDAETGKLIWEYAYLADYSGTDPSYATGPRATPALVGDRVLVVGGAGKLLSFRPEHTWAAGKPELAWERDLMKDFGAAIPRWGVACSPLVLTNSNTVVVQPGGKDASVVALDIGTGEVQWKAGSNPSGYSSAVEVGGTQAHRKTVLALTGDALLAIRPSDGNITDRYEWKTDNLGNIATPLVVNDYVFISSAYGKGCALLRLEWGEDGAKLVEVYARRGRAYQNHHSTSVFHKRHLFGFDGMSGARLKCIAFESGLEKEDWEAPGIAKGAVILTGDHLIIQTERGELCLVEANPDEFHLVAKIPKVLSGINNWTTPTLVAGRLYLRDEQKIVCYDVRP